MVSNEPPQQRRGSATPRLEQVVEALLFLAPEPVSTKELAEACEVTEAEVDRALDLLGESLAGRGLVLREVAGALARTDFTPASIDAALRDLAAATGRKLGQVAQPLRAALTGSTASPGIDATLAALGKEEALARLASVT